MIEQWILVVNSLSVITAIFLINFNDQHQAGLLMSELMGSGEKCPQVDRAQLTGAGCWYSTRVFLIHICNVEQCSKLFRQGSSRLLFGWNLAYHDRPLSLASFTDQVVCLHRVLVILSQNSHGSLTWQPCSAVRLLEDSIPIQCSTRYLCCQLLVLVWVLWLLIISSTFCWWCCMWWCSSE